MTEHQAVERHEGISYVEPGEQVTSASANWTWTVQEPCETNRGYWYCITHDKPFARNVERDHHALDGRNHRLAWVCYEHGAEKP